MENLGVRHEKMAFGRQPIMEMGSVRGKLIYRKATPVLTVKSSSKPFRFIAF
jgi:hypothetical protein